MGFNSFSVIILLCFVSHAEAEVKLEVKGAKHDVKCLMALKQSITSDPLKLLADWQAHSTNACNWTRITCTSKHPGRVSSIDLGNSSLGGSISPSIGNLSFLHYLDLSYNDLRGGIPPSIGGLRRLKYLFLMENHKLGGIIPKEVGGLVKLKIFSVSGNGHVGNVPPSLCNCSNLYGLELSDNGLTGYLPSDMGSLSNLQKLGFAENSLKGRLPDSMANLTSLTVFVAWSNYFNGALPMWLGGLINLEGLYLWENNFTGTIPESLGNATSLVFLQLALNRLHGTIPLSFAKLSMLEELVLSRNDLVSSVETSHQPIPILEALFNCSRLVRLGLNSNKLDGILPSNFGLFWPRLQLLSLKSNFIGGNIPNSIERLSRLIALTLGDNYFEGEIPRSIGRLKTLQYLHLENNKLQGRIPSELALMNSSLNFLSLSHNKFAGPIPLVIGKLVNLRTLDLSMNFFSGSIPSEVGNCMFLEELDLSSNQLSGQIPQKVANLKNIQFSFNLSRNFLLGPVPREIGGLQTAEQIDLSSNKLSGDITYSIIQWLNVQNMNLSFNSFSGILQESLGEKLPALQVMDLSYNNFTGPIPVSLSKLSNLRMLNISNNNFQGRISCSGALKILKQPSLNNNTGLCGNCPGLKSCNKESHRTDSSSSRRTVLIIVLSFSILGLCTAAVIFFLFFKNKDKITEEEPAVDVGILTISEDELQRATDNFSPLNLLGEGTHGSVYKGLLGTGEVVAVKVFSFANHKGSEKVFLRECQTLGKVRHRNLLRINTVCSTNDFKALILPFMPNGSLDKLLHQPDEHGCLKPLHMQIRSKILQELASGLSYLHHDCSPSIVHCDIKPQNVLLDNDMTVKLCDFGLACLLGDSATAISSTLKGSIGYVAPEYGIDGGVSWRGDVYSFGVVALEVITRLRPTDAMFVDNVTLSSWVSVLFEREDSRKIQLRAMLEGQIEMDEELELAENILKVGILCTSEAAESRPTMREVEAMLRKVSSRRDGISLN